MGTHPIFESDFRLSNRMSRIQLERTLALIKPDSVDETEEIVRIIKTSGFSVLAQRRVKLSPEQVSDFYAEHYGKMFFTNLVSFMSAGPVVALVLGKDNTRNAVHGSDSRISSAREIGFFFPQIRNDQNEGGGANEYLEQYVTPTLNKSLAQLAKEKPKDPLQWLADHLEKNNPNKPDINLY